MKRHPKDRPVSADRIYTALQEQCSDCGRTLPIYQVDSRMVEGLDACFWMRRRDKRCHVECPGPRPIIYAPRDLRLVLPRRIYGLDVTLHVGEHHLLDGISLSQIARDLKKRGVPLDQRHACRVFRDFIALTLLERGNEVALQERLRAQGGIILMCDGVQFEDRSPVLYLVWDALSGEPLFGERKPYRGEDDLVPLLERVRDMNVPVIGIVTDKEKGLVPAVQRVFPDRPYQFCQTHFLKNCAKPLQPDLTALQASVRRRADEVREIAKQLAASTAVAAPADPTTAHSGHPRVERPELLEGVDAAHNGLSATAEIRLSSPTHQDAGTAAAPAAAAGSEAAPQATNTTAAAPAAAAGSEAEPQAADTTTEASATPRTEEQDLVREICELARVNSRVSGKAPLDPPELKRHLRLEQLRALANDALEKKLQSPPTRRPAGPSSSV
jgi:hypothetical protein